MSNSVWGYFVVVMGIVALLAVNYIGAFANNNEIDYYALKEAQQAAMMDSIDFLAYREEGEFRINREVFIEQFTKRFAQATKNNRKYKITFKKINETPPFTNILVESQPNVTMGNAESIDENTLWIKNEMNGILILEDPQINIATSTNTPPIAKIATMYLPCTYVNGKLNKNAKLEASVQVSGIETDTMLTGVSATSNGANKTPAGNGIKPITINYGPNNSGKEEVHDIRGRVTAENGLAATASEIVKIGPNDTCIVVTQRPTVMIEPLHECSAGAINVKVEVKAPYMTDIHYTINGGTKRTIGNTKTATIPIRGTGVHNLKVWAMPRGSNEDSERSVDQFGTYTIVDYGVDANKSTFSVTKAGGGVMAPGTWTNGNINVTINPNFKIGDASQTNTKWSWLTKNGSAPYETFSYNLGNTTKTISQEGYRYFRAKVNVASSKIGLGCADQEFPIVGDTATGSGKVGSPFWYGIDKTPPRCTTTVDKNYWTQSNVRVTGTCSDSLSGCASSSVSTVATRDGNYSLSPGRVCDIVGNCTTCPGGQVRIDRTPPAISCTCSKGTLGSLPYCSSTITASYSIRETGSGLYFNNAGGTGSMLGDPTVSKTPSFANWTRQTAADGLATTNLSGSSGKMSESISSGESIGKFCISAYDLAGNSASGGCCSCPAVIKDTRTTNTCISCSNHHIPVKDCPKQQCIAYKTEQYCKWK